MDNRAPELLRCILTELRMTEQELISKAIGRDREALSQLVETYQRKIIKTAYYYLGNMEDAEDLSQEIFVKILTSLPRFRQSSSLSTWIYRIAVNESLNAVRRNRQRQIFCRIERIFGITENGSKGIRREIQAETDTLEVEYQRQWLWEAISSLPEKQRTVFILHKMEELPYAEISSITGQTLSSVESLMHRARLNLQKKLLKPDITNIKTTSHEL